jgi:hypothetical protein
MWSSESLSLSSRVFAREDSPYVFYSRRFQTNFGGTEGNAAAKEVCWMAPIRHFGGEPWLAGARSAMNIQIGYFCGDEIILAKVLNVD